MVHPYNWKFREWKRFYDGIYTRLPWDEHIKFWGGPEFHYAHVSTDDETKVAYTPSERHGLEDRQVRMKPGKYLNKYFSDVLGAHEVQYWAGQFARANEKHALRLATEPDEIEHVYENGPDSCMTGKQWATHPVRAYGAGDLAVAYVEVGGEITARTICWPEKRVYISRFYGDKDRLEPALIANGYKAGTIEGARLLRIPTRYGESLVCPWIDGDADCVYDDGAYLILSYDGTKAQNTSGVISHWTCERCGDSEDESEAVVVQDESWCRYCYENHGFYCESCDETYHVDCMNNHNDRLLCDGCYRDETIECEKCCERVDKEEIAEVDGDWWCKSCWEDGAVYCEQCEEYTRHDNSVEIVGKYAETWCKSCAVDDAFECPVCGDWTKDEDGVKEESGATVCEMCVDDDDYKFGTKQTGTLTDPNQLSFPEPEKEEVPVWEVKIDCQTNAYKWVEGTSASWIVRCEE